ncbi:hypothetical protein SBBP2_140037 [Burkholderiales bacterium]|nr:hypothetical protein SBBP2_140037 [Burkholderiales bacterium]
MRWVKAADGRESIFGASGSGSLRDSKSMLVSMRGYLWCLDSNMEHNGLVRGYSWCLGLVGHCRCHLARFCDRRIT